MDWRTEPPSHPLGSINLFASNKHSDGDGAGGHDSNGRHHASSGYTTTNTPFIFHSASMEVDHPSASTSRSALDTDPAASEAGRPQSEAVEEANSNNATREIANGAVQRERRRREQKKGWQIVEASNASNKTGAAGDSEDSGNEDTLDDISHAPSAAAATSAILVSLQMVRVRATWRLSWSLTGLLPLVFFLSDVNAHANSETTPASLSISACTITTITMDLARQHKIHSSSVPGNPQKTGRSYRILPFPWDLRSFNQRDLRDGGKRRDRTFCWGTCSSLSTVLSSRSPSTSSYLSSSSSRETLRSALTSTASRCSSPSCTARSSTSRIGALQTSVSPSSRQSVRSGSIA